MRLHPRSHDGIRLKLLSILLEVHLRYISYCQKQAFFEDQYHQLNELQNGKDCLGFRVITESVIAAITLESKETFLKLWNFFCYPH